MLQTIKTWLDEPCPGCRRHPRFKTLPHEFCPACEGTGKKMVELEPVATVGNFLVSGVYRIINNKGDQATKRSVRGVK